ncbi:MAG: methionine--tRNA ligase [Thermoanaerobaculia bacterium]|nr:methionine--tRNA ligase [Thermoanaerobaculia bacterium]
MKMSTYYITTPIYYVNDLPHIGHIYTTMVTDTVARYQRMRGRDVYFLTGTDEHGQNIERVAESKGIKPLALADRVVERYHQLWSRLGMTHDDFIRTSEERHEAGVHEIIRLMEKNGDFYLGRHEGWYCPRCEIFYTEKELLDGNLCPIHKTPCEWKVEENVFFRLSKYQDRLLKLYDEHPEFVRPASRLNEVRSFVEAGLRDMSVSRTTVSWAVPFAGFEGHTVYVWLDALTNYISALGFGGEETKPFHHYWATEDPVVHFIGKDILRFHAVFWPAFLMSAGLPLPKTVWAHGWWLLDGKKVSKSAGGVVRPDYLIERFGGDPLRYFLLRDMVFGQDASFSDEAFIERYNGDLANDLGNTTSRLVTLCRRAFDGHLPPIAGVGVDSQTDLAQTAAEVVTEYHEHMEAFAFQEALRSLYRLLQETNQYLVRNEPWKKMKDPDATEEVSKVLWSCLEALRIVTTALLPVLPQRAPQVLQSIGAPVPAKFGESLSWGGLPTGGALQEVKPLFPRIDKDAWIAEARAEAGAKTEEHSVSESEPTQSAAGQESPAADSPAKLAEPTAEERIGIEQFFETQLRVARVVDAEKVPKSSKLMQLTVDVGEENHRTVVAGIAKAYDADDLVGKLVVVVANLKPAKLMGIESNGMVLAATEDGQPVLLHPERDVPPGTQVR